jgi:membrane protease YdiL (CAAX protease family)
LTSRPHPPRFVSLGLAVIAGFWAILSDRIAHSAADGINGRLPATPILSLLEPVFLLFLLCLGFTVIAALGRQPGGLRTATALPARLTSREEWLRGTALGWLLALVAVVPMMLTGSLHPDYWFGPRNWLPAIVSVAVIALGTLAVEIAFRGYLFARLIDSIGTVAATIVVSVLYAIASDLHPNASFLSVAVAFFTSLLLCNAYLRTHGIWVSWGLHFGWAATTALFLGLPSAGDASLPTLVTTSVSGPEWLTGGAYGPDAALLTGLIRLLALVALFRITRDYAWRYTHPEIVSAGYAMDIAPPAEHTAMENAATARPAPLVQILGATPTNASTMPVIEEHLRQRDESPVEPNLPHEPE